MDGFTACPAKPSETLLAISCPRNLLFNAGNHLPITIQPLLAHLTRCDRLQDGALWFLFVLAVAELTGAQQGVELAEASFDLRFGHVPQAEFTESL